MDGEPDRATATQSRCGMEISHHQTPYSGSAYRPRDIQPETWYIVTLIPTPEHPVREQAMLVTGRAVQILALITSDAPGAFGIKRVGMKVTTCGIRRNLIEQINELTFYSFRNADNFESTSHRTACRRSSVS